MRSAARFRCNRSSRGRTTSTRTCRRATRFRSTSSRWRRPAGSTYESGGTARSVGITRVHLEEDAGKSLHEGFRRLGPCHVSRLQSQRRAAHRDRHRAGSALGRRRQRVLQPAARDPRRHRRERREHGRGQPALRRQRLGAARRDDDVRHEGGSEEPQLVPPRAAGAGVRDRAPDRAAHRGRACRAGDPAVGHRRRPHSVDAQQGRGARLSLFPGARPAAGAARTGMDRADQGVPAGAARTPAASVSSRSTRCPTTTPPC